MGKRSRNPRKKKGVKPSKRRGDNSTVNSPETFVFTDQQTGRGFNDDSSSGDPLPVDYLIGPEVRDYLDNISGRDGVIGYAFGEITGPYKVGSGLFDGDNIVASPPNAQEREYIKSQLSFLGNALSLTFNEVEFGRADLRFFADTKDHPSSEAAVAMGETVDVHWERLTEGRDMSGYTRMVVSHEIAHALGLDHVDALSGLSERDVFKKWGVSDSVMMSWEMPKEYYSDAFASNHQWFSANDLAALREIWAA